jgi:hypothetical protein
VAGEDLIGSPLPLAPAAPDIDGAAAGRPAAVAVPSLPEPARPGPDERGSEVPARG